MTPEQAIALLDQAVSSMQLTREQHNSLMAALQTLVKATSPEPVEESVEESDE